MCRESALYAYGETWCATCRGYRRAGASGWIDPRYER
jgi:hypothetical protein